MDGGIAGTGPASLQDSLPRSNVAAGSKQAALFHAAASDLTEDEIAGSLLNLTNPEIGRLLDRFEQNRSAVNPSVLDALLRTAVAAANSTGITAARAAIRELMTLDPERGAQLVRDSSLPPPIRNELDDLLQHLSAEAKAHAESAIAAASQAVEAGSPADTAVQILALAQRFVDTGQHINFVRAAELAESVRARGGTKALGRRPRTFTILGWASVALLILVAFVILMANRL